MRTLTLEELCVLQEAIELAHTCTLAQWRGMWTGKMTNPDVSGAEWLGALVQAVCADKPAQVEQAVREAMGPKYCYPSPLSGTPAPYLLWIYTDTDVVTYALLRTEYPGAS